MILDCKPDVVIHLADMAGVRYSLKNPTLYSRVNIEGTVNLLEQSVKAKVSHFVFASSSSVYGLNTIIPFTETDSIVKINSMYASTKKCKEIMASYYNGLTITGLRFFTVYGPRGRPDMAPYKFLKSIMDNKEITKFGDGSSMRDYIYIDDIVEGIIGSMYNGLLKQGKFEI